MSQCSWYLLQRKYYECRRGKRNKVILVKIIYMATRHFMAMEVLHEKYELQPYTKSYTLTANRSCRIVTSCFWLKFSITWSPPTVPPKANRTEQNCEDMIDRCSYTRTLSSYERNCLSVALEVQLIRCMLYKMLLYLLFSLMLHSQEQRELVVKFM